jgi:prevent-host-death family protein
MSRNRRVRTTHALLFTDKILASECPGFFKVDTIPYGLYSISMTPTNRQLRTTGAEEARKQLPALLAAAAQGRTTIITKHGRAVAAVVPAESITSEKKQSPITAIAGSGKGLWGKTSTKVIAKLRDEWSR